MQNQTSQIIKITTCDLETNRVAQVLADWLAEYNGTLTATGSDEEWNYLTIHAPHHVMNFAHAQYAALGFSLLVEPITEDEALRMSHGLESNAAAMHEAEATANQELIYQFDRVQHDLTDAQIEKILVILSPTIDDLNKLEDPNDLLHRVARPDFVCADCGRTFYNPHEGRYDYYPDSVCVDCHIDRRTKIEHDAAVEALNTCDDCPSGNWRGQTGNKTAASLFKLHRAGHPGKLTEAS